MTRKIYSINGGKTEVFKPAIRIATAGITIGLAVMIVPVRVMFDFKHIVSAKVIESGNHIRVANSMTLQTSESCPIQMTDSLIKVLRSTQSVEHVQRFVTKQDILKTGSDFLGVVSKGVGPDFDSAFIHQNLMGESIPASPDTKDSNEILLSVSMAKKLKLETGDRTFAYSVDHAGVRVRCFTIAGVYQTNLAQYDDVTCFMDLYTAVKLNGWERDQVPGAEITVKNLNKVDEAEAIFINRLNRTVDQHDETYSSKTIKDISPQIFSWSDLLGLNAWIIPALMTAVVGVTMTLGLLIIILERVAMIDVLKATGAENTVIGHTFLWSTAFTITRGLLIGNLISIGLVLLQRYTGLAGLDPQTHYVTTVPVEINIPVLLLLNVAAPLISVVILVTPSYPTSHIHPTKSTRYE